MSDVQELARKVLETGAIEMLPGWARCCVAGPGGAYVVGKVDGDVLYGCEFTDFEIAAICWECLKWVVEHEYDSDKSEIRYGSSQLCRVGGRGWRVSMGDYQCDPETAILKDFLFLNEYDEASPSKPEPEHKLTLEERVARLERRVGE